MAAVARWSQACHSPPPDATTSARTTSSVRRHYTGAVRTIDAMLAMKVSAPAMQRVARAGLLIRRGARDQ